MPDTIETVSRNIQLAMAANASDPEIAASMQTPRFRKALRELFGKKAADEMLRNLSAPSTPTPAPAEPAKLSGDRIDDARSLMWEADALCNVGRAAYQDVDLDVYNTFGAILRLLEGAQEELDGLGKAT